MKVAFIELLGRWYLFLNYDNVQESGKKKKWLGFKNLGYEYPSP
jgi:hypothetical protein